MPANNPIPSVDVISNKPPRRLFGLAVAVAVLGALAGVLFNVQPSTDVAEFYGPMAREFAEGHYARAFVYYMPPLTPVMGGLLSRLTGLDAFQGLKLFSGLCFVGGLFVFRRLARRLVPAGWLDAACLMYALHPCLMSYATEGLLDEAKMFFLLLAVEQGMTCMETGRWRNAACAALAAACLVMSRREGMAFMPLIGWLVFWRRAGTPWPWRLAHGALRGFVFVAIWLLALWPYGAYQMRHIGYPSLELMQELQKLGFRGRIVTPPETAADKMAPMTKALRPVAPFTPNPVRATEVTDKIVAGLGLPFLVLGAAGFVALRRERRPLQAMEWVALAVIGLQMALCILLVAGGFSKRHLLAGVPFLLPWSTIGLRWLAERTAAWRSVGLPRRLMPWVLAGCVAWCLYEGLKEVRHGGPHKRNVAKEVGQWIAARSAGLNVNRRAAPPPPSLRCWDYRNGREPVVVTGVPQIAWWARADWINALGCVGARELLAFAWQSGGDVLVTDERFQRAYAGFDPRTAQPPWRLICTNWAREGFLIYQAAPVAPGAGTVEGARPGHP